MRLIDSPRIMKLNRLSSLSLAPCRTCVAVFVMGLFSVLPQVIDAATVLSGTMTVDFSQTQFGALGTTGIQDFTQTTANSLTRAQILSTAGDIVGSWSNLPFAVNGTTVIDPDPGNRFVQATNFTYNPSNLTGTATGQIGLGGVTKWSTGLGPFFMGDYALEYDASRVSGIYSGWFLQNHFDFDANAFGLANVVTSNVSANGFSLVGNLVVRDDSGLTFFGATAGTSFGSFSFTASTSAAPEPSKSFLMLIGLGSVVIRRRRSLRA